MGVLNELRNYLSDLILWPRRCRSINFFALARSGVKVWPAWLFGAAVIILVGFIAAEAPYDGSATPFLVLAATCIGFVSWGLAALMAGVFSTLK